MKIIHQLGFRTILIAVILIQVTLLFTVTILGFSKISSHLSEERERSLSTLLSRSVKNSQTRTKALLNDVTTNRYIQEAFAERDELYDLSYPLLNRFHSKGLRLLNYYQPDGSVYLKTEDPQNNQPVHRPFPSQAAQEDRIVFGVAAESGTIYNFVASPLYVDGVRRGIVEMGVSMRPILEELEAVLDSPVGLAIQEKVIDQTDEIVTLAAEPAFASHSDRATLSTTKFNWKDGKYRVRIIPLSVESDLSIIAVDDVTFLQEVMRRSELLIFAVGLLSVIVFSLILIKILKPLSRIVVQLEEMGRGDLRGEIEAFAIRELSMGINRFLSSLKKIIGKVYEVSESVASRISSIHGSLVKLMEGADQQSDHIHQTSTEIQRISASAKSVAKDATALSHACQDSSSAILEMTASIGEVAQSTKAVSNIVEANSTTINGMISSIQQISQNIDQVFEVSNEASSTVQEFGTSLKVVESNANESAVLSEKVNRDASNLGMKAIEETIQGMRKIQETVIQSAEVINRLGERSEEVGKILTVINEVTRQTNLLALNAAILAAQSGEHGKGFAVVAEQIKELASRTTVSTKEIAQVIREVQTEARGAVDTSRDGAKLVEEGVRLSIEAGNALQKILLSSEQSREMTHQIQTATREQTQGIHLVTQAMQRINHMIEEIALAARNQHKEGEKITTGVEELRGISYQVKQATVDLTRGSQQISKAVEDVNRRSQSIASSIQDQEHRIGQIVSAIDRIKEVTEKNRVLTADVEISVDQLTNQSKLLRSEIQQFKT